MRTAGILIVLCCALAGCKDKKEASASPDPAAVKAQQDLMARREALMAQRKALEGERDKLDAEIKKREASGEDASELTKQRDAVVSQIEGQNSDLTELTNSIQQVVAQGSESAAIAAREATIATREKSVAQRESQFADRERALAQREAALAQREKETCGTAAPMIIQQVAAPKGGAQSKSDVQPVLAKAKKLMSRKGILDADLPAGAQNLEDQAAKAMNEADWGKAYIYAAQLLSIVESMKIDRSFIQVKMTRLNRQAQAKRLDEATNQQVAGLLREIAQRFGDGNYAAANTKLNQLAQKL